MVLLTVTRKEYTAILEFTFNVLVACKPTGVAGFVCGFKVDMSVDSAVSTFDVVLDIVLCHVAVTSSRRWAMLARWT